MSIETALATDLSYIIDRGNKHSRALGFLPRPQMEAYIAAGQVIMAIENNQEIGFLVHGRGRHNFTIYQTFVEDDARRLAIGTKLICAAIDRAKATGREGLKCHCAADLESNQFWRALAFEYTDTRQRSKRRERPQIGYWYPLPIGLERQRAAILKLGGPEVMEAFRIFGYDQAFLKRAMKRERK